MARVHGLIYEKNYQLKEDDPARKFKGRSVLFGDQVKDQNQEAIPFPDLKIPRLHSMHQDGQTLWQASRP